MSEILNHVDVCAYCIKHFIVVRRELFDFVFVRVVVVDFIVVYLSILYFFSDRNASFSIVQEK